MARPTSTNVTNRQVVNTIEDSGKYQTGYARRLKTVANPLRIESTPEISNTTGLVNALSTIEPTLMDYAIKKQSDAYALQIAAGERKAQTGVATDGEMEQYGYDNVKAINDWTDFNASIANDYDQNFDKENGNLEEFLKAKWETVDTSDKSSDYLNKFSPLVGKSLEKIRENHAGFKVEQQTAQNNVELMRLIKADIKDVQGQGLKYDSTQWQSRRWGLNFAFKGKTNAQLDSYAYEAVLSTMEETGDTSLAAIFKDPNADGTPGLYEIPKWNARIKADVNRIDAAVVAADARRTVALDKALNVVAGKVEVDVMFALSEIGQLDSPEEKDAAFAAVMDSVKDASDRGIPIASSIVKAISTAQYKDDKAEGTAVQKANAGRLLIQRAPLSSYSSAFIAGDITLSTLEKAASRASAAQVRADKGEAPLATNKFVKEMGKTFKNAAGYSYGSMETNNGQKEINANATQSGAIEYVEELVDGGMPIKEAVKLATDKGLQIMKDKGLTSDLFEETVNKVSKGFAPVKYYKANPNEYLGDVRNKTVLTLTPAETLAIQKDIRANANKAKKPKDATKPKNPNAALKNEEEVK
tara:strand:- start:497 stop:2251 length:1755 start_codon:yes stop_codon:yes gene_type:complete